MILSAYYLNNDLKINHRDLKPENFLIFEKEGKKYLHLNGFGIPKHVKDEYYYTE